MKKSSLKRIFSFALAAVTALSLAALPADQAFAADNKGLRIKASFPKVSSLDKAWDNSKATTRFAVAPKTKTSYKSGSSLTYTVYIPQDVLSKKGAEVAVDGYVDVNTAYEENGYIGVIIPKSSYTLSYDGSEVNVYGWNGQDEKEMTVAQVKKSTKLTEVGEYYKFTVKNTAFSKNGYIPDGEEQNHSISELSTSEKYYFVPGVNITVAAKQAISGEYVYVDDIKFKAADTISFDFSKKTYEWADGATNGKDGVKAELKTIATDSVK